MPGKTVLVTGADASSNARISVALQRRGYIVVTATEPGDGLRHLFNQLIDLIIIDTTTLNTPHLDGWELCRLVRDLLQLPVIMLTAEHEEDDRLKSLELGADDCLSRPFSIEELAARVQAQLRRTAMQESQSKAEIFAGEDLWINFDTREVRVRDKLLHLTPREYSLLTCLVRNAGRILSYNQLLTKVWGGSEVVGISALKQYIWRLRQKIEEQPKRPCLILTRRGLGYLFRK